MQKCKALPNSCYSLTYWCTANYVKLNTVKTKVISFSRKINILIHECKHCQSSVFCTDCIKDLGVFLDSKLHFHNHLNNMFSQCVKLLSLVCSIISSFLSLECLCLLYFILGRSKLEYISVVWNSVVY
jgi:hypothetical protein